MVRKKLNLTLSQAIEGFMLQKRGQRLSKHTLKDYANSFRHFQFYFSNDPLMNAIESKDISDFFDFLGTTPQPNRSTIPRKSKPLSNKSLLNVHAALSSLWSWAVREGAAEEHIIRRVPRPKPEKRAIVPLSKEEVEALLEACEHTASYEHNQNTSRQRPTALRDQVIIRLLVDTGIRASELCALTLRDVDLENQRIKVYGKGAKERILGIGVRTTKSVWRYIMSKDLQFPANPLISLVDDETKPMERRALGKLLSRIGKRAGVPKVHPHRFRHTFAITYLRNNGDIYSLQAMLGHTSLEMVREYLAIAQADVLNAHRKASPVDNWGI